jgi:hypothetical protein
VKRRHCVPRPGWESGAQGASLYKSLSRENHLLSHQGVTGMSQKTVLLADDYEDARMILKRL